MTYFSLRSDRFLTGNTMMQSLRERITKRLRGLDDDRAATGRETRERRSELVLSVAVDAGNAADRRNRACDQLQ